jgi:hypothetical protein
MRSLVGVGLLLTGLIVPSPAAAQEVETLRKELEQMRKQFDTMKEGYEKAINQLGERLQQLENRPQPATAPPPAAPPPAAVAQAPAPAAPAVTINPMELARPREPFSLYTQRGPGQLLFDMGVTGDFIGNLTQSNVDKANAGSFPGRENRFFPREIELSLFGQIDPYARAEVRFEAGEEDQGEINLHLAEANLTLMSLPFGTQLKMGQMRNRFGLLNPVHEHDRPFIDAPNVLARFLGEEGLVERGAELTWVAPLPFFLEALVGAFNGDNETAFGRGKLTAPLVTGRLRTFFELGDESAIQLGASVANGETPERHRNTLLGFDAKYKYRPEGWLHPLLTLLGEMIYQNRRVNVLGEDNPGHPGPDPHPQPLGLVRGRRGAALPHRPARPLGRGPPLRLDPVPGHARPRVGGRPVPRVHAVRVPPLPPRLQVHRAGRPGRLHRQRRERPEGGRDPLPGHVHHGRPPGASVLDSTRRRSCPRARSLAC